MPTQNLTDYISCITESSGSGNNMTEVHQRLRTYLDNHPCSAEHNAFYEGEKAFLRHEYDTAYELQKEMSENPQTSFFFYRTAAFYLEEIDDLSQASYYAQKALEKAPITNHPWHAHLELLAQQNQEDPGLISIDSKELDEINEIFASEEGVDEIETILGEHLEADDAAIQLPQSPYMPSVKTGQGSPLEKAYLELREDEMAQAEAFLRQEVTFAPAKEQLAYLKSSDDAYASIFFSWKGVGICIDPCPGVLEELHRHELSLNHIDFVILTKNDPQRHKEVRTIYEWNHLLNRHREHTHTIQYYLPSKGFQNFLAEFSFYSREERNSMHALEFYRDSQGKELLPLSDDIRLHYFASTNSEAALSMRFDLHAKEQQKRLAFLSDLSHAKEFSDIDLLILNIGGTNLEDIQGIRPLENQLGYTGATQVIQKFSPKLTLLAQFPSDNPRLKMAFLETLQAEQSINTALLVGESSLELNLEKLWVKCSAKEQYYPVEEVSLVQSNTGIQYLHRSQIFSSYRQ